MSDFVVVPVRGHMIGGHYAVEHTLSKRVIGRSFGLDRTQADVLRFELETISESIWKEAVNDR